ncbi:unnamed protein product [Blepharisma stoltei]|uniref:VTT domain-containing protein n=1 Tax=Blepharisma stoltei TaxID=1481888 RepID=A0AAU9J222_9CILI|nr:unnamed protein product [Blepharisma stoltei]
MELDLDSLREETEKNLTKNKFRLLVLFSVGILGIFIFIALAPDMTDEEKSKVYRLPLTPQEIYELSQVFSSYTENSYLYVLSLFCFLYLLMQSFAIPGPIVLSLISGTLFGRWVGLLIVTICATTGSTICYFLSDILGKGIIVRAFPDKIQKVHGAIQQQKENVLFYLLFLRVVPIVPNWLINLTSPIIGIPIKTFFLATLFGLIPPNCIHINTGMALSSLGSTEMSYESIALLVVLGVLIMLPPIYMKYNKSKKVKI